MKAIRDNEPRAISLGYKVERFKLLMFVLAATLAEIAGATKALVFQLASLTDIHWMMSGEVVLMALVGGVGTVYGPMFGALVIVAMETYLASLGSWVTVVQGAVFVVWFLPSGRASPAWRSKSSEPGWPLLRLGWRRLYPQAAGSMRPTFHP